MQRITHSLLFSRQARILALLAMLMHAASATIPGGFNIGDTVYSLIKEIRRNSDQLWLGELSLGDKGTVMGPASDGDTEQLRVDFGNGGKWNLFPRNISRTRFKIGDTVWSLIALKDEKGTPSVGTRGKVTGVNEDSDFPIRVRFEAFAKKPRCMAPDSLVKIGDRVIRPISGVSETGKSSTFKIGDAGTVKGPADNGETHKLSVRFDGDKKWKNIYPKEIRRAQHIAGGFYEGDTVWSRIALKNKDENGDRSLSVGTRGTVTGKMDDPEFPICVVFEDPANEYSMPPNGLIKKGDTVYSLIKKDWEGAGGVTKYLYFATEGTVMGKADNLDETKRLGKLLVDFGQVDFESGQRRPGNYWNVRPTDLSLSLPTRLMQRLFDSSETSAEPGQ